MPVLAGSLVAERNYYSFRVRLAFCSTPSPASEAARLRNND